LYVISSVAAAALPLQAAISLCPSLSLSLSLSLFFLVFRQQSARGRHVKSHKKGIPLILNSTRKYDVTPASIKEAAPRLARTQKYPDTVTVKRHTLKEGCSKCREYFMLFISPPSVCPYLLRARADFTCCSARGLLLHSRLLPKVGHGCSCRSFSNFLSLRWAHAKYYYSAVIREGERERERERERENNNSGRNTSFVSVFSEKSRAQCHLGEMLHARDLILHRDNYYARYGDANL
jgi:hypothetical protein